MAVKVVFYIMGGNQGKGYLKIGSWGEYLILDGMRMASREGSRMRNFKVRIVHLI